MKGSNVSRNIVNTHAKEHSVKSVLSEHYRIDYYQRDYAWEKEQILDLLSDLKGRFLSLYKYQDRPEDAVQYNQYFMGSFVINTRDNQNYIVDGQQRLTSLTLLMIYLQKRFKQLSMDTTTVSTLVKSDNFGRLSFNIEDDKRNKVMSAIYDYAINGTVPTEKEEAEIMFQRYKDIESYMEDNLSDPNIINVFFYWLIERVMMVRITTGSVEEAYSIFETMNDRGKSLSMLDMFKGYVLSLVDDNERQRVQAQWNKIEEDYRTHFGDDQEGLSAFVANVVRARYADLSHYTSNKVDHDWNVIGRQVHRWLREKRDALGLVESSDIVKFVDDVVFYLQLKVFLKERKSNFVYEEYRDLFYLANSGMPMLDTIFFAVIHPTDSEQERHLKIKIVSRYLEIYRAHNTWTSKFLIIQEELMVGMINRIKKANDSELNIFIYKLYLHLNNRHNFKNISPRLTPLYKNGVRRRNIFFNLARITAFIEEKSETGNPYPTIMYDATASEVEHILAKDYLINNFQDADALSEVRDMIGALGILPKTVNASMGDLDASSKIKRYSQHNMLLGMLDKSMYDSTGAILNRPKLNAFFNKHAHLKKYVHGYDHFDASAVLERNQFLKELATIIWDPESMLSFSDSSTAEMEELYQIYLSVSGNDEDKPIKCKRVSSGGITVFVLRTTKDDNEDITLVEVHNGRRFEDMPKYAQEIIKSRKGIYAIYERMMLGAKPNKENLQRYDWNGQIRFKNIQAINLILFSSNRYDTWDNWEIVD